jgi:cell division protein FtsN
MAQARRKKKTTAKKKMTFSGISSHGIGTLLAGVIIGSLGTIMWQGLQSRDSDVGSGIRQMIEKSKEKSVQQAEVDSSTEVVPQPQQTNYDFFTVLPEIEVVVSADEESAEKAKPAAVEVSKDSETQQDAEQPAQSQSAYMLQAGSFNRSSDAERQKASLALLGLSSVIQKISIQGRGDFYRVRLGPFINHAKMLETDERLQQEGIKALRLKVSKAG